jgi:phage head maturation protease
MDFRQKNNSKVRKIYDVSPVTYPAYVDTEVASRSLTAFKEENKPEQRSVNHKKLNAFDAQIIINSNL